MNYVIKVVGYGYYAGPNHKYSDMWNISGLGIAHAKRLTLKKSRTIKKLVRKRWI